MALEELEITIEQETNSPLTIGLTKDLEIGLKQDGQAVYISPKKVREVIDALVLTLRAGSMVYRRREEVKRGRNNQRGDRQVSDQGGSGRDQR